MSSESPAYIKHRPTAFEPNHILFYLDKLDKYLIKAESEYDEVKDQVDEMFDFIVNEKIENESIPISRAKVKATNDQRYKDVRRLLSKMKAKFLVAKIEAKNGHSYCDHLKQQSINQLAIDKLTLPKG
tara:strand:+ start:1922 stop:2305 length:384 start_codon:yes stop_codon:yes gene_type:complete